MKAAVFHHPKSVQYDTVPDPRIEEPTDAIVRVTATAICGSDLHIYNGLFPQVRHMVLGHEFMGIVEEVGSQVTRVKRGDRVVVPFPIACGACFFCERGLPVACEHSNADNYGPHGGLMKEKGGGLFGYTDLYGGYDGGQAEAVRVPFADVGPRKVPESLGDEQALFLTDILPTGWSGVDWAGVKGGETVAVFGCGPVGLMAMKAAWLRGAARVIGVDIVPYRLEMARKAGKAETIDNGGGHAADAILQMTGGRGADVCIDAVGMEAHRNIGEKAMAAAHLERGSIKVLEQCMTAARRGGFVSILGVYGTNYDNFPLGQWMDKGLSMKAAQAPVHVYIDELIRRVESGHLRTDDIISHVLPLADVEHAYKIFNRKEDGCVKVVLRP
jgi:S-(hydroxymethyl)glutathione dehydrogenase/alcohol dehydrogenase